MKRYIKRLILVVSACYSLLVIFGCVNAQEITILYTGETHAMLYPCSCPKESDGGVARRAALIEQLKKKNQNVLVLDSGGFFAGGLMDEYTQNTELDRQRTLVNLKAMQLMQYDAVAIGDDEFNFGKDFLGQNIAERKIPFLSCNLKWEKLSPYIIKEISGTKIGIIGVTNPAVINKAVGLKFIEPKAAVKQAIEELKKKGANIILLLSHLGETQDLELINGLNGIDILITGHNRAVQGPSSVKIGSTLVLRPAWQGQRLGKLSFRVKDNKIANYKIDELRLSDKIKDDPKILSILPLCFRDSDCKKEGLIGRCQEAGTLQASCLFNEVSKINLLIIAPKKCIACDTQETVRQLKAFFPGLVISYLYYPHAKSNKLIKDLNIQGLPAYLLDKEIEKEKNFDNLKGSLEKKGNFYIVKPQFGGVSYFVNRKKIKGGLDLFISLYDKNAAQLLDVLKDFHPTIHFLVIEQGGKFDAEKGISEVEEYLRSMCVQKYYPEYFWNYISCRAKNIYSSWWEDCLGKFDSYKIRTCARGEEGSWLLRENIQLNKELQVMFGPVYLLENQETFATVGVLTKEEFKKILKR